MHIKNIKKETYNKAKHCRFARTRFARPMFGFLKSFVAVLKNSPDPNWHIEKEARSSAAHPLGGFWKTDLKHTHGLAIGPAGEETYFISFCGPGGCFEKGTYRGNTEIYGDDDYKVIDINTIEIKSKNGFKKYQRSESREST